MPGPERSPGARSKPLRLLAPGREELRSLAEVRSARGAGGRPGTVSAEGPRACARVPLPAIMAAGASERSRRARPGSCFGAKAARAAEPGTLPCPVLRAAPDPRRFA